MCTRVRRSLTPAGVFQVHVVEYDEEEETINCENVYRHGYAHSAPSHSLSQSAAQHLYARASAAPRCVWALGHAATVAYGGAVLGKCGILRHAPRMKTFSSRSTTKVRIRARTGVLFFPVCGARSWPSCSRATKFSCPGAGGEYHASLWSMPTDEDDDDDDKADMLDLKQLAELPGHGRLIKKCDAHPVPLAGCDA